PARPASRRRPHLFGAVAWLVAAGLCLLAARLQAQGAAPAAGMTAIAATALAAVASLPFDVRKQALLAAAPLSLRRLVLPLALRPALATGLTGLVAGLSAGMAPMEIAALA